MPNTPVLGLSVFIHLMIILAHRAFKWSERKTRRVAKKLGVSMYVVGCGIIALIFFIVSCFATVLLYVSVLDHHSNVQLAERTIPKITQVDYGSAYAEVISAAPQLPPLLHDFTWGDLYVLLGLLVSILAIVGSFYARRLVRTFDSIRTEIRTIVRILTLCIGTAVLLVGTTSALFHIALALHISLAHPPIFAELLDSK